MVTRQTRPKSKVSVIYVEVEPRERRRFESASERAGFRTLSEWVRFTLRAAAAALETRRRVASKKK